MTRPVVRPDRWIRRFHAAEHGSVQLVCFPHAGGSASFFHPVSERLAPDIDVSAVQYPGRQDRRGEPGVDDLGELADMVAEAVAPLGERPLAFFGHSMGALLAYEVAIRLERAGTAPLLRLFASGRRAPSRYRPDAPPLDDDRSLIAKLEELSGTESGLLSDPETREMVLPAVRTDYRAVWNYRHRPGETIGAPITALVGDRDSEVTEPEARDWAGHSRSGFTLRSFRGGHFYLVGQAPAVIRVVADELAGARRKK